MDGAHLNDLVTALWGSNVTLNVFYRAANAQTLFQWSCTSASDTCVLTPAVFRASTRAFPVYRIIGTRTAESATRYLRALDRRIAWRIEWAASSCFIGCKKRNAPSYRPLAIVTEGAEYIMSSQQLSKAAIASETLRALHTRNRELEGVE